MASAEGAGYPDLNPQERLTVSARKAIEEKEVNAQKSADERKRVLTQSAVNLEEEAREIRRVAPLEEMVTQVADIARAEIALRVLDKYPNLFGREGGAAAVRMALGDSGNPEERAGRKAESMVIDRGRRSINWVLDMFEDAKKTGKISQEEYDSIMGKATMSPMERLVAAGKQISEAQLRLKDEKEAERKNVAPLKEMITNIADIAKANIALRVLENPKLAHEVSHEFGNIAEIQKQIDATTRLWMYGDPGEFDGERMIVSYVDSLLEILENAKTAGTITEEEYNTIRAGGLVE